MREPRAINMVTPFCWQKGTEYGVPLGPTPSRPSIMSAPAPGQRVRGRWRILLVAWLLTETWRRSLAQDSNVTPVLIYRLIAEARLLGMAMQASFESESN